MPAFRFVPVTPHVALVPYVARIWVFESAYGFPVEERKLIVPNANLKLTLTCTNGIHARVGPDRFIQQEHEITLTGLVDTTVHLEPVEDTKTVTIVIEFFPSGAYRLFRLSFAAVHNSIVHLNDLVGQTTDELQSRLTDANTIQEKVQLLQQYLVNRLQHSEPDGIFDYCINRINATKGVVSVSQLEKETGYSARWLHRKFTEHLGTGAKNLSEIVRFKQFYSAYASGLPSEKLKQYVYQYYHDQSHFLRAFKRFTGATPTELANSANELSKVNYIS